MDQRFLPKTVLSCTLNSVKISHCGFSDLSSKRKNFGGAVNAHQSNVVISGNTVFSDNLAYYGGAICLQQGTLLITAFTQNGAAWGGGKLLLLAKPEKINKIVLFLKKRAVIGGALFADIVAELEYSGTFLNNTAFFGGAIQLINSTAVAERKTRISENYATVAGRGIYLDVSSALLQDNTAAISGGAMYVSDSRVSVNAAMKSINNSAVEDSGCYLTRYSSFTLESEAAMQFTHNTASDKGEAMFIDEQEVCGSILNCEEYLQV